MEKILLYLIVVVLLLSLTACGKKKEDTTDPTSSETSYTTPVVHIDPADNGDATGADKEQANGNGGSGDNGGSGATKPDGQSHVTLPDEWNDDVESPLGGGEELPYMPID